MGLDWLPMSKPKPGREQEFQALAEALENFDDLPENRRVLGLFRKSSKEELKRRREELERQYDEASIPAYTVVGAPRVGHDAAADEWLEQRLADRKPGVDPDDVRRDMQGYYVLELVTDCDGVPRYSNGGFGSYVEASSFRAQFLESCMDVIDKDLLEEGYEQMTPDKLRDYGDRLLARAGSFSRASGIEIPDVPPADLDSPAGHLHIVVSAGRWCKFWAERGHGLEPYF
jgi:hypothetical protein